MHVHASKTLFKHGHASSVVENATHVLSRCSRLSSKTLVDFDPLDRELESPSLLSHHCESPTTPTSLRQVGSSFQLCVLL